VDSAGALLVLADRDLNVVVANREFGTLLAVDVRQVVGTPLPNLLGNQLPRRLTRRTQFAVKLRGTDGQERLLSMTATPARDQSGDVSHVVLLGVDETERRQMEQALHDLERHATVGEMAGTMAHEISQPLQAIDLACASALTEIDEPVNDKGPADVDYVRHKLALIEQQVRKASRIMGDLRSFVRGTVISDSTPFDVNQTVRHAGVLLDYGLRQDGVSLMQRLADGLPPVVGQGAKFEQILINLFNNARDAGARTIEVETERANIEGRAGVRVSVLDSGPGIPPELMGKLFHSFVTTKPEGKGTGLGLRICRRLVEEMNGTITVSNREEGGAKFDVFLPTTES
jgi:C4-dicarboxylate-specific signal transduction histidine kinase